MFHFYTLSDLTGGKGLLELKHNVKHTQWVDAAHLVQCPDQGAAVAHLPQLGPDSSL